ncbi:MAG TPA: response regulator [Polyangiales bacterium]
MLERVDSVSSNPSKHTHASSILVVDDENASGELVATLLRSQGYCVKLVADGRAALPIIARGGVDLVLLDLMMSRMDGVEVCAYVRNELRELMLPILITTSLNDRESRIRAKEAGADDVLIKPIDGLELLVRIDCLLQARTHYNHVLRERDRLREELAHARMVEASQQRALRTIEGASESLRSLLDRQRVRLENAKKRWANNAEAREELARFTQITAELAQTVELLSGAASGTVLRVSDGETSEAPEHRASFTATK